LNKPLINKRIGGMQNLDDILPALLPPSELANTGTFIANKYY
jgi:hypothetical protein